MERGKNNYTVTSENPPRRTKWQEKIKEEMAQHKRRLELIFTDCFLGLKTRKDNSGLPAYEFRIINDELKSKNFRHEFTRITQI